jgi:hypothetical protein
VVCGFFTLSLALQLNDRSTLISGHDSQNESYGFDDYRIYASRDRSMEKFVERAEPKQ